MNEKRLQKVLSDEGFAEDLLELETPEQVQAAFREKGIEISIEQIISLRSALIKELEKAEANNAELSVEDLDDVAGGYAWATPLTSTILRFALNAGVAVHKLTRGRW